MDKKEYIEHVLSLTEKSFTKELEKVYEESKLDGKHLNLMSISGVEYTIEQISADLYLNMEKIDEDVRFKFYVLYKIYSTPNQEEHANNIFILKRRYEEEKYKYFKESLLEKIEKMKNEIISELSILCKIELEK